VRKQQFTAEGRLESTIASKQVKAKVGVDLHSKRGEIIDFK